MKKNIALPKPGHAIGLEYDHQGIRGVRISLDGKGGAVLEKAEEVNGDFSEDDSLIEGLKQLRDRLGVTSKETVVSCIAGKQVSASEITFRRLPAEEMETALRLEMRKSVPFEVASASLDFQVLTESTAGKSETCQVLVTLASSTLLSRHLKVLEKVGLKPAVVDVLPVAVANALWQWVGDPKSSQPHVAVHIGPQISTIVIDGPKSAFFNRYVYFAAEDVLGKESSASDRERRIQSLADEISRSLAFYEKSAFAAGFQEVVLLGEFLGAAGLQEAIRRVTGLSVRRMDLAKKMGFTAMKDPGQFDLALALGSRGDG